MMKVLITGAAGVVGGCWIRHAVGRYNVIGVDLVAEPALKQLDMREEDQTVALVHEVQPDVLLHFAANKNILYCEHHPDAAHDTNVMITQHLVKACLGRTVHFVFLSSDYVFGAEDRFWRETDAPCPSTQYGRGKAESEAMIRKLIPNFAIVRTAGLYGFPNDFIDTVRGILAQEKSFPAYTNIINNPTYIKDLFFMLDIIISKRREGVFHCVGPESLTRFQYARQIAEVYGLDADMILPERLDLSKDLHPPILRLDGAWTYKHLDYIPGRVKTNMQWMANNHT